jgi:hypothetical protein
MKEMEANGWSYIGCGMAGIMDLVPGCRLVHEEKIKIEYCVEMHSKIRIVHWKLGWKHLSLLETREASQCVFADVFY